MKLNEAIVVVESANKILEKDIPISFSFKLERVIKKLQPDVAAFFKKRQELIEKNSTKNPVEEGKEESYTLTPEQQTLVNAEIEEMAKQEIEFPESLMLSESIFDKIETIVTGTVALGLSAVIKHPE